MIDMTADEDAYSKIVDVVAYVDMMCKEAFTTAFCDSWQLGNSIMTAWQQIGIVNGHPNLL